MSVRDGEKKNIIVFGTGKYFDHKKQTILQKYHITGFLDNKVEAHSTVGYKDTGITIMNPQDTDLEDDTDIFLMSVHFVSMWKQLCETGVDPGRLVFPYLERPFFENEEALDDCLKRIEFEKESFLCILRNKKTVRIRNEDEWRAFLREAYRQHYPLVNAIAKMGAEPVSRQFGTERGMPVDRVYIERFLREHAEYIRGEVLEIEDNTYTEQFGRDKVGRSLVMDVSSRDCCVTFQADLESGEGIRNETADCFICTQTLMYIYDLKSAAHNICRLLKKGGTALITCSGISQNSIRCMDNYGCYFNFNEAALVKMFEAESSLKVIESGSYGNVKTVSAHLNGLCREDLDEDDFLYDDKYYPLIVYAVVKKDEFTTENPVH